MNLCVRATMALLWRGLSVRVGGRETAVNRSDTKDLSSLITDYAHSRRKIIQFTRLLLRLFTQRESRSSDTQKLLHLVTKQSEIQY